MSGEYRTTPVKTDGMPPGIPYIIGNEVAERFSFYGMRGILVAYMTKHLLSASGEADFMGDDQAKAVFHMFTTAVYFFPILGALLADIFFGKYRTILALSLVYCLGHFVLAVGDTGVAGMLALEPRTCLYIGLALIAFGSGGIKPCVSAHVGDQFGVQNRHKIRMVYDWFYFAINFGAFLSPVITPWLLEHASPSIAFGVPGILMFIATIFFWVGRTKFVHIPAGGKKFIEETFSREGVGAILRLSMIYIFIAPFWALFDQTGSSWVLQAEKMDLSFFGYELLPSQIQAANPLMILAFIPLFAFVVYPAINKVFTLTPLRKISIGFFVAALSFAICAWIEHRIQAGETPHGMWQILAYAVLTSAEVMVSITGLEFSYTQAPKQMKSVVMGTFFLSVSLGNAFTAMVNVFIQNEDGTSKLAGPSYFWFFTAVMGVTALLFVFVAGFYKGKTYMQGDDEDDSQVEDKPSAEPA